MTKIKVKALNYSTHEYDTHIVPIEKFVEIKLYLCGDCLAKFEGEDKDIEGVVSYTAAVAIAKFFQQNNSPKDDAL